MIDFALVYLIGAAISFATFYTASYYVERLGLGKPLEASNFAVAVALWPFFLPFFVLVSVYALIKSIMEGLK